jgi:hypothetical protein
MLPERDLIGIIDERARIVYALSTHPTMMFHLTGSYALGGYSKDSDLDFFTDVKTLDTVFLTGIGFYREATAGNYRDALGCEVFGHEHGVHIQVVKDVDLKLRAQNILLHQHRTLGGFLARIKKTCTPAVASEIWNLAIELARRERGA